MNRCFHSAIGFLLALCFSATGFAQVIATFDHFNLERGEYINDASPEKGFQSGLIELPNFYDAQFDFWSGWAISADTNTTTPGFLNQYSAIAGEGAQGSKGYAMGYLYDPIIIRNTGQAIGKPMIGMYVTNSTYAYLSMRDGDAFAKKFGGETGTDPDFFRLTIKKFLGGVLHDDSLTVFLADYRSNDPSKDFILDEWKYISLTNLGEIDSLQLSLTSSDNGIFGMNTPAYMAIDEVSNDNLLSAAALRTFDNSLSFYPNPATENIYLQLTRPGDISITNLQGIVCWSGTLDSGNHQVAVSSWPRGMYVMMLEGVVQGRISLQ